MMAKSLGIPLLVLLIHAAAQCCAGFSTSAPFTISLPSCCRIIHTNDELSHNMHCYCWHEAKQRSLSISMLLRFNDNHNHDDNHDDIDESSSDDESSDENEREKVGLSWEEMMADPKLRLLEDEASRKEWNALLLPQRISQAVTTLGWMFVLGGAILPYFGFAYVRKPEGGIGIGSLDERDFQRELMRKDDTPSRKESKTPTTISISRSSEETNGHIISWLHKEGLKEKRYKPS